MTVPGALVLVIVALTGLLALMACMALFLWVAARYSGQPITFRGTGKLVLIVSVVGALGLAVWVFAARPTL